MNGNTARITTLSQAYLGTSAIKQAAAIIAGSLFVALCAHISAPLFYTPVPVTMQTFAVLLVGLLLGPGAAFASLALYLLEGVSGLPVFNPLGPGGILQLMGPTGGYLLSYPFAAAAAGYLYKRVRAAEFFQASIAAALGSVIILVAGAAWMAVLTHAGAEKILALSVVPFLPGDILKLFAAAAVAAGWQSWRTRRMQAASAL